MEIKRERLDRCLHEVAPLLLDYWKRTNAQEGQPPLNVNWVGFQSLEDAGKLILFTARIEEKLVGYDLYMLYAHIKYVPTMWAMCDTLAVNPDYRGRGIGTELVKYAEKRLKHMGVDYIVHGYRTDYNVTPLFEKLGFTNTERVYMKVL